MDLYVKLAKEAIDHYVRRGEVISPPGDLPPEMRSRAGVFVTIRKDGKLRGCIGTFLPTTESIAHEIIGNAVKAATEDPRFPPLSPEELGEITVSVDVLSPPQECTVDDLDPVRYGVIVESGWRRGLLLPDLPEVRTVEEQVAIARMKAGIGPGEPFRIYRFTVTRHHE